ncbi:hypothetical protein [Planctomicrobium piriforme]|uniref:Uncharacterized protein n=1 Tax=Planctomicrobium piriforme TaxID=1576369 RepID=A0A1I3P2E3_9PLAN|nr:hypothetical protein [Planctomicrobium piriforme]SFJ15599.1 hypothetical protein SAMN05421753_11615 [Planctomicrobium piriforme]
MATLTPYKGIDVVEDATGDAGIALTENFKELADRAPYEAAANPGTGDDGSDGFSSGDQWLNTSTQVMWICISAGVGAAVWKSLFHRSSTALELIPSESSEKVKVFGNLEVAGTGTSTVGGKLQTTGVLQVDGTGTSSVAGKLQTTGDLQVDGTGSSSIAGKLGLGTTSPSCPVHIVNTGNTPPCIIGDNNRTSFDLYEFRVSGAKRGAITKNGTGGIELNTTGSYPVSLMSGNSKTGILTTSPTAPLDVNGDSIRIRTAKTPSSATDTGNAGDVCWDSSYVYICVATNTWKRAALSTW